MGIKREIIKTEHLKKAFGAAEVLRDMTMRVYEGEIYGFLGENGAGKTTLMRMLLNLLKADSGTIEVAGVPVVPGQYAYLEKIGSMIETPAFYTQLSGYENLQIHCQYHRMDSGNIREILARTGLEKAGGKKVCNYSLGMKQRLGLARALVTRPQLLILDEPINGLDPVGIRDVRTLLQEVRADWGTAILISSHIVSEIQVLADRISILSDGRIVSECAMKEIEAGKLEEYFLKYVRGGKEQ